MNPFNLPYPLVVWLRLFRPLTCGSFFGILTIAFLLDPLAQSCQERARGSFSLTPTDACSLPRVTTPFPFCPVPLVPRWLLVGLDGVPHFLGCEWLERPLQSGHLRT